MIDLALCRVTPLTVCSCRCSFPPLKGAGKLLKTLTWGVDQFLSNYDKARVSKGLVCIPTVNIQSQRMKKGPLLFALVTHSPPIVCHVLMTHWSKGILVEFH